MKKEKKITSSTSTYKNKKKDLGLGIKALLNNIDEELKGNTTHTAASDPSSLTTSGWRIPLDLIEVNPKQPRRDFDPQALAELAESIKMHDIIQPVTVTKVTGGRFSLISGERRFRAAKMAGLTDIPAYIRTANDQELLEMALLENLQRENLNAIEIALSYKRLMDECSLNQEQVSERMKKERSTVTNYLRLLKLPPDIQKAVRDGRLGMGHARALISLDKMEDQLYAFREILQKGLSVRQVEQMVKSLSTEKKDTAGQGKNKPTLPPAYKRIEDSIGKHFSAPVLLRRKKNGKGNIVIDFDSDEDLERIMKQMSL